MHNKKYSFQYNKTQWLARISRDALHLKNGRQKNKISLNSLQYLYINSNVETDVDTLLLRYKCPKGAYEIQEIKSNNGQDEFKALINALVKIQPDIDIRNMAHTEANALFVVKSPDKLAPKNPGVVTDTSSGMISKSVLFIIYLTIAVGIILFPSAYHLLDTGQQSISAETFIDGTQTSTHNITITDARLLKDYMSDEVTVSTNYKGTAKVYINYFALVTQKYSSGTPVQIILKIQSDNFYAISQLLHETQFTGVIRNIWWEGVPDSTMDYFEDNLGYSLSKNVILFTVNDDKGSDWLLVILFGGVSSLLLLLVFVPRLFNRKNS